MEKIRHKYILNLLGTQSSISSRNSISKPTACNTSALATLMLDAYQGTIDYDDETFEDAIEEVQNYFNNHPILNHSAILIRNDDCIAACLISYLEKQKAPLIAYIMTKRESKRTGLARALLDSVLVNLEVAGFTRVLAVITEGNVPSERLFNRCGFKREGT
jgi:RimJ/RimL family protein N-acetyltransferase